MKTVEGARECIAVVSATMRRHIADFFRPAAGLRSRSQREPVGLPTRTPPFDSAARDISLSHTNFEGGCKGSSGRVLDRPCGRWALAMRATGVDTFTCSVPQPFRKTIQMVRAALKQEGLSVPIEIDASARMHRTFGVERRACRVICIDCPLALLPAAVVEVAAIGLFPLHVVVASEGAATSSVYLATPPRTRTALNDCFTLPYQRFVGRVLSTIVRATDT